MAKGNLLQGMARGKVGDLVFSRMDGEQITRVRNRRPRNPKTNKQLYQRAIMATVSQLYAAGQEIFNHSFEGAATPADNQRRFMSENVKILRSLLANDLNTHATDEACQARFAAPGNLSPIPNRKIVISDGLLDVNFMIYATEEAVIDFKVSNNDTVAGMFSKNGLNKNSLITIVSFINSFPNNGSDWEDPSQWANVTLDLPFRYLQLAVRDDIDESAAIDSGFALKDVFILNKVYNAPNAASWLLNTYNGDSISYDCFFNGAQSQYIVLGNMGVILSEKDSIKRSRSYLNIEWGRQMKFGLTSNYVLDAWKRGAVEVGDSDYILEGGDSHPITPTPDTTPSPPAELVENAFYSIDIPLVINGVTINRPVFKAEYDPELDWQIRLACRNYNTNSVLILEIDENGELSTMHSALKTDIQPISIDWSNLVTEELGSLYEWIYESNYIITNESIEVLYNF